MWKRGRILHPRLVGDVTIFSLKGDASTKVVYNVNTEENILWLVNFRISFGDISSLSADRSQKLASITFALAGHRHLSKEIFKEKYVLSQQLHFVDARNQRMNI